MKTILFGLLVTQDCTVSLTKSIQITYITNMAPRDSLAAPEDTTVDEGANSEVNIKDLGICDFNHLSSRMMRMNLAEAQ